MLTFGGVSWNPRRPPSFSEISNPGMGIYHNPTDFKRETQETTASLAICSNSAVIVGSDNSKKLCRWFVVYEFAC